MVRVVAHPKTLNPEPDPRPLLGPALLRLCRALIEASPHLAHVDLRRIVWVAGQARGSARASIRPLIGVDPDVRVILDRRRQHYEITLRPLWFHASSPGRRLESLVHELWHIGPQGGGQLDPSHRHQSGEERKYINNINSISRNAARQIDPVLLAALGHDGEVLMPAWLRRPVLTGEPVAQRKFGMEDMYLQVQRLCTTVAARAVWW